MNIVVGSRAVVFVVALVAMVAASARADARVRCSSCVLTIGGTSVVVTGEMSPSLDVTVRAARWQLGALVARDVVITAREGRAGYRACLRARLGAAAVEACGTLARSFAELRDVTWSARTPRWSLRGTATLARSGELVGDVVVIAGDVRVPIAIHGNVLAGRVTSAVASVLGGELSVDPVALRWPLDLTVHARGLALARMLPELVRGTGEVDGVLAVRVGNDGVTLASAELHARGTGELRVADTRWMPRTTNVHQRVAAMLDHFQYEHLSATIAPRGRDPEALLAVSGHGQATPQALDLVIRLHGARGVAQRLFDRVWSSS